MGSLRLRSVSWTSSQASTAHQVVSYRRMKGNFPEGPEHTGARSQVSEARAFERGGASVLFMGPRTDP